MRHSTLSWSIVTGMALLFTVGAGAGAQTTPSVTYSGPSAEHVRYVLTRVSGWRTPSCGTCSDGVTPSVSINQRSQRDAYVAAAVTYAWGAQAYHSLGNTEKAEKSAENAKTSLERASALCGDEPSVQGGGSGPQTLRIWPCPAPF